MEPEIKENLKTLIVIGGLPCLATSLGFLLAFAIYPEDGFRGMLLVTILTLITTLISIYFLLKRILTKSK